MKNGRVKKQIVVDIEVYRNFFCAVCHHIEKGKSISYHIDDRQKIASMLKTFEIVTFNGNHYDLPILGMIANGKLKSHSDIKDYSDRIINEGMMPWNHDKPYDIASIDLKEVAPGVGVSLKLYGGRMHVPKMQDLPIEPNAILTDEEMVLIEKYCHNDIDVTLRLFKKLAPQIQLRRDMSVTYETDLMSKSDAQIAESVFRHELKATPKPVIDKKMAWEYVPPPWMTNAGIVKGVEFSLSDKLVVTMPKELKDKKIEIGDGVYRMGIGGLHSSEKSAGHAVGEDEVLRDIDVASYYPNIILGQGIYPEQLGKDFLSVYEAIVTQRLTAKKDVGIIKVSIALLEKELKDVENKNVPSP